MSKETWVGKFKNIFVKEPGDWRETGWAVSYVEAGADALERFIEHSIQEAVLDERRRVSEEIDNAKIGGTQDWKGAFNDGLDVAKRIINKDK